MRVLAMVTLIAVGCASTPEADTVERAVYEGYTVESVREAARSVVEEVAHPKSEIRVHEGRVITEGWFGRCGEHVACGGSTEYGRVGTPWTTLQVRFRDMGTGTAAEVAIEYETEAHCGDEWNADDPGCLPQRLSSTGVLEREVLDRIRARLEESEEVGVARTLRSQMEEDPR